MVNANAINLIATGLASHDGSGVFTGRTVTGTADFIDVVNGDGVSGDPTLSIATKFLCTGKEGWNGAILETEAIVVTSDGATITLSVEKEGGGDLIAVFSDGYYIWDTSPADTVTLTQGSDTSPVLNFIYFLQSTKVLTASTSNWPTTEHIPIATVLCQSAASLQTQGAYKVHAWIDHVVGADDMGHMSHLNFWIRHQEANWLNGVSQTYTITPNGGSPDNVIFSNASGKVMQLHCHTFPAFAGTPDVYVVNDSVTPYNVVTDLNSLLTDSTGASMSTDYFSLVIWGSVSEDTGDCKLYVNLPSGSYNNSSGVEEDLEKFANYTIPSDFRGTGFLISEWKLRHQNASGGTWTSIDEIDIRGLFPSISAGGSSGNGSTFVDNAFRVLDDLNNTKEIAFQADQISVSTTRTITMADQDIDLTPGNTFQPAFNWIDVTASTQALAINSGYIGNRGTSITYTLPTTAAVGSIIEITNFGAGLPIIAQNAGESINYIGSTTTVGVTGSLSAVEQFASIKLVNVVADTVWNVISSTGSFTVV